MLLLHKDIKKAEKYRSTKGFQLFKAWEFVKDKFYRKAEKGRLTNYFQLFIVLFTKYFTASHMSMDIVKFLPVFLL